MPLYGHELTRETKPAQAGLGRVVVADKESFVGKDAVESPGRGGAACWSAWSPRAVAPAAPATRWRPRTAP